MILRFTGADYEAAVKKMDKLIRHYYFKEYGGYRLDSGKDWAILNYPMLVVDRLVEMGINPHPKDYASYIRLNYNVEVEEF